MELKALTTSSTRTSRAERIHTMELKVYFYAPLCLIAVKCSNPYNGIESLPLLSFSISSLSVTMNPYNGIESQDIRDTLNKIMEKLGIHTMELKGIS